eukprot:TRINITY_DN3122_c0_g1_i1.p1 TRINITY_DN3122_c0_g1~~TRINITY_DN3122_c0_g1_i1.p1  ORF type:complete len:330 (+),score=62.10 TRINITY_DN3122_c0_g1_i1:63-1052(+)
MKSSLPFHLVNAIAKQYLSDDTFVKLFTEAAATQGPMPAAGSPEHVAWLQGVQAKLQQLAADRGILKGKDDDGTEWKMILPAPCFVVKTTNGSQKVFVNVCTASEVKEPSPVEMENGETQWRVPLSLGAARKEKDNNGAECTVYDVAYNNDTLAKALNEPEFKELIIAVGLEYLKQKSEPNLETSKWTIPKMKHKGEIAVQRVRIDTPKAERRKLGDLDLPEKVSATVTPARSGQKLITEVEPEKEPAKEPEKAPNALSGFKKGFLEGAPPLTPETPETAPKPAPKPVKSFQPPLANTRPTVQSGAKNSRVVELFGVDLLNRYIFAIDY